MTQLRAQVERLQGLGRELAVAAAARIDADGAIADTALAGLSLPARKRARRRAQVRRLERLLERVAALEIDAARGRRGDLRRVARAVRRIISVLTSPDA